MSDTADKSAEQERIQGQRFPHDKEMEKQLQDFASKHEPSASDLIHSFPLLARRTSLRRFLAHYELFRLTTELPGDIVEVGVFRGHSLMSFANFLEIRNMGDRAKTVWGLDNFAGFTELSAEDGPATPGVDKVKGGYNPSKHLVELQEAIKIFDKDRFVPFKPRVELVIGDVDQTIPAFIEKQPGLRISLLNLDVDLYKPTMVALEHFFPRVVSGGVVIFDEYALLDWGGESQAVEEYLGERGYTIKRFEWTSSPGGYLIKR